MTRRFAEDTSVPTSKTQDEIKVRLRAAGADRIAVYEDSKSSAIAFSLGQGMYRVTVPIDPKAKNRAQDERRAWRLLGLLIKSKLEAVREGATTVEREFLADRLLPDGATMGEWSAAQLQVAYERGQMPTSLLIGGPS